MPLNSSQLDSLPDFDEPQPLQDSNNFADNPSDSFNADLPDFDNITDSDNTVSNELEDSSFDADFSADSSAARIGSASSSIAIFVVPLVKV